MRPKQSTKYDVMYMQCNAARKLFHDVTSSLCTVMNFWTSVFEVTELHYGRSSFHIRFHRYISLCCLVTIPDVLLYC